ncbi:uncharacterized protein LOC130987915 [Salvia miltiorrhiza]|uniref:uncharacterized protein LOC130987915 n=1 Tax=Salvia miltiorrhiza TaxID=226208 RepID=UPI0025AC97F5|nr:uncharacterized protein LOC130987915 [Salvia miltiorrhiza]
MDAEYHKLKAIPSFKYSDTDDIPRFQKLRTVSSFKHVIDAAGTSPALSRQGSETDEIPARFHKLRTVPSFKHVIDAAGTPPPISREGSETDEIPPRFQKLRTVSSFKHVMEAAAISREGSETDEIPIRYQKLRAIPSFKHVMEAAAMSREGSETDGGELPRYTSLKDVMSNLSPSGNADIAIRNELVKHAASAYVLSATIINPGQRDGQNSRMKMCCLSCWRIHVGLPLQALCWPIVHFVYQIVRRVRNALRLTGRMLERTLKKGHNLVPPTLEGGKALSEG